MNLIPVICGIPSVRGVSRKIIVVDADSSSIITNCSGVVYNMDTIVINRSTHFEVDRVYCFMREGGVVRPIQIGSRAPSYTTILRRTISCCADYGFVLSDEYLNCRSNVNVCGVLDPEDRGLSFAPGDVIRLFMQPSFRSVVPASFVPVECEAAMIPASTEIETNLQTLRNNSVGVNRLLGADKWNRVLRESETNRTVKDVLASAVGGRRSKERKAFSLFSQVLLTHRTLFHYPPAGHLVGGVLYYIQHLPLRDTLLANIVGFMWYDLLGFAPFRSQKKARVVSPLVPSCAVSVHTRTEYLVTTRWLFDNLYPEYESKSYQHVDEILPSVDRDALMEVLRIVLDTWFHTESGICPIHNLSPGELCVLTYMFYRVNGVAPNIEGCSRTRVRCLSSWLVVPCEELGTLFSNVLRLAGYRVLGLDDIPYVPNVQALASGVLEGTHPPSFPKEWYLDVEAFNRVRPSVDLVVSLFRPPSSIAPSWQACAIPIGTAPPRLVLPSSPLDHVARMFDVGDANAMLDVLSSFGVAAYHHVCIGFLRIPMESFHFTQSLYASASYYSKCFSMMSRLCAHLHIRDISLFRFSRYSPVHNSSSQRQLAPHLPFTICEEPRRCVICFESCMVQLTSRPCMRFDSHFVCPGCVHVRCPIPGCSGEPLSGRMTYPTRRFPGDDNAIDYFPEGPEHVDLLTHEFKDCTEDTAWRSLYIRPNEEPIVHIQLPYVRNFITGYDDSALDPVSTVSYAHFYACMIDRDFSRF